MVGAQSTEEKRHGEENELEREVVGRAGKIKPKSGFTLKSVPCR